MKHIIVKWNPENIAGFRVVNDEKGLDEAIQNRQQIQLPFELLKWVYDRMELLTYIPQLKLRTR